MRTHTSRGSPADTLPSPLFAAAAPAELVTDLKGTISGMTPGAAALLRVTPAALRGVSLATVVRRSDRERLSALLSAVPPDDGARVRVAVAGGLSVEAELTLTAQRGRGGRVTGLRWRVRDHRLEGVPDEPAAAGALRRRMERLRDAGRGICLVDHEGKVTWAGPVAEHMLGRSAHALVGRPWPESGALAAALRHGREGSGTLTDVPAGDGSMAALDYVVVPLVDEHRVLGAALAFTRVGSPA